MGRHDVGEASGRAWLNGVVLPASYARMQPVSTAELARVWRRPWGLKIPWILNASFLTVVLIFHPFGSAPYSRTPAGYAGRAGEVLGVAVAVWLIAFRPYVAFVDGELVIVNSVLQYRIPLTAIRVEEVGESRFGIVIPYTRNGRVSRATASAVQSSPAGRWFKQDRPCRLVDLIQRAALQAIAMQNANPANWNSHPPTAPQARTSAPFL